ncbi:lipoprotein-releasing ABC transporter permease subunit [Desulfosarcina sp. OttesenSCG-928-A07]|nr:lipoprotein-releasing ABC transporter permease subunit [Desulfosarcina sp. OttesenSCG-928-A07]
MSFVATVSRRYLRTRQKRAFISLVTVLSVAGVAVGVMALMVVISVMSGFESDIKTRILGVRPHLVITGPDAPFTDYPQVLDEAKATAGVDVAAPFIAAQVILRSAHQASGAMLKGVDEQQKQNIVQGLDLSALSPQPDRSHGGSSPSVPEIILGKGLARSLGAIKGSTIYVISPRGALSPIGHIPAMVKFRVADLFSSGMYEFDNSMAFIRLSDAQKLFRMPGTVSGIELRLTQMDRTSQAAHALKQKIGSKYAMETWQEMNQSLFSAIQLEKIAMFIILTLIVLVAAFNIAGSLVMRVMEKRKDIAILKTMGATSADVGRIFVVSGMAIGLIGTVIGTIAGLILCTVLKESNLIRLPADIFYITTLPVDLQPASVFMIILCTMGICFAATVYPARQAARINPVEALRHG